MRTRYLAVIAVVAASVFLLGGCSTQARAERKGKSAGDQICKAKDADNANEAERHLRRADDKLDDLARFTGRDVREDVRDLDRNLRQICARQRHESGHQCDRPEHRGRPSVGNRQHGRGVRRDAGGTRRLRLAEP